MLEAGFVGEVATMSPLLELGELREQANVFLGMCFCACIFVVKHQFFFFDEVIARAIGKRVEIARQGILIRGFLQLIHDGVGNLDQLQMVEVKFAYLA